MARTRPVVRCFSGSRISNAVGALLLLFAFGHSHANEADPEPQDPYRQAVLIGVWQYANAGAGLGDMGGDLAALSKAFRDRGFDAVTSLPNPSQNDIELALNDAATLAVQESSKRATLTVVYFGGHGMMVDHASYLLASDYVAPVHASDVVLQGGIRTDHVGSVFSKRGQPSLLIVEACRNPFTPGEIAQPVTVDEELEPIVSSPSGPMISAPKEHSGYSTFFGQEPGQIVELLPRTPEQPTPLVSAFLQALPLTGSAGPLFAAVRNRVIQQTQSQRHPLKPEYIDRGGGELYLYYDDIAREFDRRMWEKTRNFNDPDLVKNFLDGFRTSRYVNVARHWLENNEAQSASRQYASYTRQIGRMLGGRRLLGIVHAPPPPREILRFPGGSAVMGDIAVLRRVKTGSATPVFEAQTTSGRTFEVTGPLPSADPSKVPDFWSGDNVTKILCDAGQIEAGQCAGIEEVAKFAKSTSPDVVGTLFVATVFNAPGQNEALGITYDRTLSIAARLRALGVPKEAIGFRSFHGADLPDARAPILVKRGDSKPFPPGEE